MKVVIYFVKVSNLRLSGDLKENKSMLLIFFSKSIFDFFFRRNTNFLIFQFEPRQYVYQFEQYAHFFSKQASGMLINYMLIKKTCSRTIRYRFIIIAVTAFYICRDITIFVLDFWHRLAGEF